jgi:hypothetical protein
MQIDFKIGQIVRISKNYPHQGVGEFVVITRIISSDYVFPFKVRWGGSYDYPLRLEEIEEVTKLEAVEYMLNGI